MSRSAGDRGSSGGRRGSKRVTLKDLAEYLGLSPATISRALNGSPQADALAPETRKRVLQAARKLNYRPNYLARSLRGKRTFSVGVLVPEISEGYAAGLMSGVEAKLAAEGYFYLMVSHRSKPDLRDDYLQLLQDRGVEGFLLIAMTLDRPPDLPTVVLSGQQGIRGVTRVGINHDNVVRQALTHLRELGHRRIAVFRGSPTNVDSQDRWRAVHQGAEELALEIPRALALQLRGETYGAVVSREGGYQEGYAFGQRLLERRRKEPFSALFAYNDISAIGAIRAFQDAGLDVPGDISVMGFDDIQSAPFHRPALTTVRQPLREMGELATNILLRQLAEEEGDDEDVVALEPELVVRSSTGPAAPSPE